MAIMKKGSLLPKNPKNFTAGKAGGVLGKVATGAQPAAPGLKAIKTDRGNFKIKD